jgi:hypothetical protein
MIRTNIPASLKYNFMYNESKSANPHVLLIYNRILLRRNLHVTSYAQHVSSSSAGLLVTTAAASVDVEAIEETTG